MTEARVMMRKRAVRGRAMAPCQATPRNNTTTTTTTMLMALMVALVIDRASSSVSSSIPMAFAGGDLVATLKESGEAPVRTVSCVGSQGSGKSTLLRSMFGGEEAAEAPAAPSAGLALMEGRSNCAYSADTNEFSVGSGQTMVSLAVSDVMIYNVMVHDLIRPDALSELQVGVVLTTYSKLIAA